MRLQGTGDTRKSSRCFQVTKSPIFIYLFQSRPSNQKHLIVWEAAKPNMSFAAPSNNEQFAGYLVSYQVTDFHLPIPDWKGVCVRAFQKAPEPWRSMASKK